MEKTFTNFHRFSPMSYPGRIYGMYIWDWNKNKWIVDEKFCKDNGIMIKNNENEKEI